MTSLVKVGLVIPVPVLVMLGLALVALEGQAVAPEGQVAHLAQHWVGMLGAVVVWVVPLLSWLLIYVHCIVSVTLTIICLEKSFSLLSVYQVSLL